MPAYVAVAWDIVRAAVCPRLVARIWVCTCRDGVLTINAEWFQGVASRLKTPYVCIVDDTCQVQFNVTAAVASAYTCESTNISLLPGRIDMAAFVGDGR